MAFFSPVNIFGSVILIFMMLFYIMEQRSGSYTLAFGFACLGASLYGWMAGTWPFGIIEFVWGMFAFNRWAKAKKSEGRPVKI